MNQLKFERHLKSICKSFTRASHRLMHQEKTEIGWKFLVKNYFTIVIFEHHDENRKCQSVCIFDNSIENILMHFECANNSSDRLEIFGSKLSKVKYHVIENILFLCRKKNIAT